VKNKTRSNRRRERERGSGGEKAMIVSGPVPVQTDSDFSDLSTI